MEVDLPSLKLDLVGKIIQIKNPSTLLEVKYLLDSEKSTDWWDNLPVDVQDSILEGMEDIKEDRVFTHEHILEEAKEKYGF